MRVVLSDNPVFNEIIIILRGAGVEDDKGAEEKSRAANLVLR
jgi:hypothetical protein